MENQDNKTKNEEFVSIEEAIEISGYSRASLFLKLKNNQITGLWDNGRKFLKSEMIELKRKKEVKKTILK